MAQPSRAPAADTDRHGRSRRSIRTRESHRSAHLGSTDSAQASKLKAIDTSRTIPSSTPTRGGSRTHARARRQSQMHFYARNPIWTTTVAAGGALIEGGRPCWNRAPPILAPGALRRFSSQTWDRHISKLYLCSCAGQPKKERKRTLTCIRHNCTTRKTAQVRSKLGVKSNQWAKKSSRALTKT